MYFLTTFPKLFVPKVVVLRIGVCAHVGGALSHATPCRSLLCYHYYAKYC